MHLPKNVPEAIPESLKTKISWEGGMAQTPLEGPCTRMGPSPPPPPIFKTTLLLPLASFSKCNPVACVFVQSIQEASVPAFSYM